MAFFQAQRKMCRAKSTTIGRRPAGLQGPEVGDFFQMGRPVMDVRIEQRANLRILPDIGVKVPQELQ